MMSGDVIDRAELGQLVKLDDTGGQGIVYRVPEIIVPDVGPAVYKEYLPQFRSLLNPDGLLNAIELLNQLSRPEAEAFISLAAWPVRLVRASGYITGFLMPEVPQKFHAVMLRPYDSEVIGLAKFEFLFTSESYLARTGLTLSGRMRYRLLKEVAGGLEFLHRYDIVFGDISPANLLFSIADPPSCHFIDCDSMTLRGVRALPEVESPGWGIREISKNELLGTTAVDSYKLGLLALRLLVGHQQTRDPKLLDSSVPRNIRQLIGRALAFSPEERPRLDEWRAGLATAAGNGPHFVVDRSDGIEGGLTGSIRSRQGSPYQPKVPFAFQGRSFAEPQSFAEYMIHDWEAAVGIVGGSRLEDLAYWLGRFPLSSELERVLDACRQKQFHPDRLVAMLIVAMAPDLPPRFRTYSIDRRSLIRLTQTATGGGTDEQDVVHRLRESGSLNVFAGLPNCDDYAELDDRWQRNVVAIQYWSQTSSELQGVLGSKHEAEEAVLLWALLDPVRRTELATEAAHADTATARTRPWFRLFRDSRPLSPQEDLLPAYHWAITAIAPGAEKEHADEVAKDRAAKLTDRLRLLNEEQKNIRELQKQLQAKLDYLEEQQKKAEYARRKAEEYAQEEFKRTARKAQEAAARAARYERLQKTARRLLDDLDGPVSRYHGALEIERQVSESSLDLSVQLSPPLPPLPTEGAPSDQIVAMASVFPAAAAELRDLAAQAKAAATWRLTAADRRVTALKAPIPSLPPFQAQSPQHPGFSRYLRTFRRLSWTTAGAVIATLVTEIWASRSYSGGSDVLGDGLRALFTIAMPIGSGILIYVWHNALKKAQGVQDRQSAAIAKYEADHRHYQAQVRERCRQEQATAEAEQERLTKLAAATARREQERSVADELKGLAHRSRLAAFDLEEIVRGDQFQWIVAEATQLMI